MGLIRGILLDIDGTLVDSNDAHAHAWVDALAEQGKKVAFEKIRPLIGMGGDKLLPIVADLSEATRRERRLANGVERYSRRNICPTSSRHQVHTNCWAS